MALNWQVKRTPVGTEFFFSVSTPVCPDFSSGTQATKNARAKLFDNEEGIKEVFLKRVYLHTLSYTHKCK
ncbi:MAG TPA: hypothetical protein VI757_12295 [Bacteroidia bacterium]|nr:hypothetical protein [Bacteroidia bacterium]